MKGLERSVVMAVLWVVHTVTWLLLASSQEKRVAVKLAFWLAVTAGVNRQN